MVILQLDLYQHMIKPAFAMLASGSMLVLLGGIYKALWKILYALNVCDYSALNQSFFPMQGPGFFLIFLSLLTLLIYQDQKHIILHSIGIVPPYSGMLIFILFQTIGCAGLQWCLIIIAKKMRQKMPIFLFLISFLTMLGMGYLSAKFDDSANMHWIAQGVNIISEGALFFGVLQLHHAHLANINLIPHGKEPVI